MRFLTQFSLTACTLFVGLNASAITLTVDNQTDFNVDLRSSVIDEAPFVNVGVHGHVSVHMPDLNTDLPQLEPVQNGDDNGDGDATPHEAPVIEEQYMTLDIQFDGDLGIFSRLMTPICWVHNDQFNENTLLTDESFSNAHNSIYYCHASPNGKGIVIEYSDLYWLKHA